MSTSTNTNEIQAEPDALTNAVPPVRLLLSVKAVAAALGISERSIWRLSDTGELPAPIRVGRLRRWRRSSIENWIAQAERKAQRHASRTSTP